MWETPPQHKEWENDTKGSGRRWPPSSLYSCRELAQARPGHWEKARERVEMSINFGFYRCERTPTTATSVHSFVRLRKFLKLEVYAVQIYFDILHLFECVVQPVIILGGNDNTLRQPAVGFVLFEPPLVTG